jgi:integrase
MSTEGRTRRGNREGTIYRRAGGGWVAEIRWTDRHGRRQRSTGSAPTETEARKVLARLRRQVEDGLAPGDRTLTVEAYWRRWREGPLLAGDRKRSTVDLYRVVARTHVLPAVGGMRLVRLTAGDVEAMLAGMRRTRASRGGAKGTPVSGQTRRTAYTVLSLMLDTAVRDGLVPRNVCADVDRPQVDTAEADYLTVDQLRGVVTALDGHRLRPLVVLLASTGMRLGEGLGLRWRDVDLEEGVVRVTGTVRVVAGTPERTAPKSLRSRRTLPLPEPAGVALRAWKATQAAERLRAGTAWHDDGHGWVFTTDSGRVLDQRNAARQYERALTAARLDVPARFHLLRHTAASLMLADGQVSVRTVADVLGHGSTRLTLDTYGHVAPNTRAAALGVIGEALA